MGNSRLISKNRQSGDLGNGPLAVSSSAAGRENDCREYVAAYWDNLSSGRQIKLPLVIEIIEFRVQMRIRHEHKAKGPKDLNEELSISQKLV
jgi:hypothetical protein